MTPPKDWHITLSPHPLGGGLLLCFRAQLEHATIQGIARMIEGLLQINLDPPYMAFHSLNNDSCGKSCTVEDVRVLLVDLNAIPPGQHWPLREFTMRLAGRFANETLQKFGLVKPSVVEAHFRAKNPLIGLKTG